MSLFILFSSEKPINLSLGAHLRAADDQAIRAAHLPLRIATYLRSSPGRDFLGRERGWCSLILDSHNGISSSLIRRTSSSPFIGIRIT